MVIALEIGRVKFFATSLVALEIGGCNFFCVILVLQPHWLHLESESATLDTDICVTVQGPQIGAGNRFFG